MVIEQIIRQESKGDDTQFECRVDKEIWIVSLHLDAALMVSKGSGRLYRTKRGDHHLGGDPHIGWEFRDEENKWRLVTEPALVNLLDCLHFACLRKDETESAEPQSRRGQMEDKLSDPDMEILEPRFSQLSRCGSDEQGFGKL
jgi:hypothetical protein